MSSRKDLNGAFDELVAPGDGLPAEIALGIAGVEVGRHAPREQIAVARQRHPPAGRAAYGWFSQRSLCRRGLSTQPRHAHRGGFETARPARVECRAGSW